MKKVLCLVFEVEDNMRLDDVLTNLMENLSGQSLSLQEMALPSTVDNEVAKHAEGTWEERTENILLKLGINRGINGYELIMRLMEEISKNPSIGLRGSLKDYYEAVAKSVGQTSEYVERNIRQAIERTRSSFSNSQISKVMGIPITSNEKVTNITFIAWLVQAVFG